MIWRWFRRSPDVLDDASAFVDGELASDRRAAFESALAASNDLQRQVEELRATKQLLASMAEAEVPRSFTISVAQAASDLPPAMRRREAVAQGPSGWFGGGALARSAAAFSVAASVALVAVVAIDVADDGGGASPVQFSGVAPQAQSLADSAQAQSTTAAFAEQTAEAAVAATEQSFAIEPPAADQAATEVVEAQAAVAALPSEQADVGAGGQASLELEAPAGDLPDPDGAAPKPPLTPTEGDGSQAVAAAAPDEAIVEEGGPSLTAASDGETEAAAADEVEVAVDEAAEPDPEVAGSESETSEASLPDSAEASLVEEAPIAEAEMAEPDASEEVADESGDAVVAESVTTEPLEELIEEVPADDPTDDADSAQSQSAVSSDVAEPATSPDRVNDQASDGLLDSEREAAGSRTETDAQAPTRTPDADKPAESPGGESSSRGDRDDPAEPGRSANTGSDAERSGRLTATPEAEPTRPEAAPAPTILRSVESDDDTLVRVLEIVFGIAAGLSVVTLFFALRRRV